MALPTETTVFLCFRKKKETKAEFKNMHHMLYQTRVLLNILNVLIKSQEILIESL